MTAQNRAFAIYWISTLLMALAVSVGFLVGWLL
jgi:hypothetical protein